MIDQLPTFTPTAAATEQNPLQNTTADLPIGVPFATLPPPTAVVIQTTPSPLPPPSATPTPTPIIYTIASGDTILGIAIDHFSTTEEILARNPGVQPNLLSIGQELILPPPATAVFSGDPATPAPLNIEVSSINSYQTPLGSVWLLGQVQNNSPFYTEDVRLELSLIGPNGTPLGKTTAWTAFSLLAPQESAPFAVLINEPPGEIEQTQVAIIGGRAFPQLNPQSDSRTLSLTVEESSFAINENSITVQGVILNQGETTAEQTQLTVTLYDSQNNISGYGQLTLNQPLPPQQRAPFQLTLAPPGAPPTDLTFHLQALTTPPTVEP